MGSGIGFGGGGGSARSSVCYRKGTRILTPRGEVAIENLAVGDIVTAANGRHVPVKWIGWRRIDQLPGTSYARLAPIRVMRHALAEDTPRRDLFVSPDHALWCGGALLPACLLANGATIAQVQNLDHVVYYHVECERRTLLLAEGVPAESFVDAGNRGFFANVSGPITLRPELPEQAWRTALASPNLRLKIEQIRRELIARAQTLGFTKMADADPMLEADGVVLRPEAMTTGEVHFTLPVNTKTLRILSRSAVSPASLASANDARQLGIAFTRLVLSGHGLRHVIAADDPLLQYGFHAAETDGRRTWRWTDGAARLPYRPLPYAMQAVLHHIPQRMEYWSIAGEHERVMVA